ncbi:unnamed protein product [Thlaspi arvense]|uniref:Uncharacterized protein n=1 Tax=Thlaspi arvense TaxID=13288 RepID=A0AAU9SEM3_THLAR|nr:unnamed protein product [Thlaspi arvense]
MVLVYVHSDGPPIFINKDMLTWYLLSLKLRGRKTRNQQSEPVHDQHLLCLPEINRANHDQDLQTHEQTHSTVVEERRKKTQDSWVVSIKETLEQVNSDDDMNKWGKICIYRVPHYLHVEDSKSYFPQTVSLGPYHYGEKQTQSMEYHKWRAVNKVLKRTKQGIEIYIEAMKKLEERARACYQGDIEMDSNDFTKMLVLDGCFVLELFRGTVEGFQEIGYAPNDPVFAMRGLMHSIQRDMVMLENQLPMFILDRLLQVQLGTKSLFSNLIAFEQCHIDSGNNITSYIIFMDNLINSSEDVSYLHYCGIIEHWLGSDSEVADLFNRLCKEVVFNPKYSYLSRLSDEVNRYYSRKWNSLKTTLKHKYFNNPWAYFSFFAAVILLILTLSQSFYAVYAYYKPNS